MKLFVFLAKSIIAKYLKQEADEDLIIFVDEPSPCGLSITADINIKIFLLVYSVFIIK